MSIVNSVNDGNSKGTNTRRNRLLVAARVDGKKKSSRTTKRKQAVNDKPVPIHVDKVEEEPAVRHVEREQAVGNINPDDDFA